MEAPKYDKNTIKWSGFFKDAEAAEESLQEKLLLFKEDKRVLSVKKEMLEKKSHNLFLFKFTIVLG